MALPSIPRPDNNGNRSGGYGSARPGRVDTHPDAPNSGRGTSRGNGNRVPTKPGGA